jgi:hypothetical protein
MDFVNIFSDLLAQENQPQLDSGGRRGGRRSVLLCGSSPVQSISCLHVINTVNVAMSRTAEERGRARYGIERKHTRIFLLTKGRLAQGERSPAFRK